MPCQAAHERNETGRYESPQSCRRRRARRVRAPRRRRSGPVARQRKSSAAAVLPFDRLPVPVRRPLDCDDCRVAVPLDGHDCFTRRGKNNHWAPLRCQNSSVETPFVTSDSPRPPAAGGRCHPATRMASSARASRVSMWSSASRRRTASMASSAIAAGTWKRPISRWPVRLISSGTI